MEEPVSDEAGTIRIVLADEQSLFREAVRVVLDNESDLHVVAEARDGLQALAEVERTLPDVALVDANLPNCNGVRATALIRERVPGCRVLLMDREDELGTLVEGLEAGASGYITEGSPLSELIDATRAIHRGETLIPTGMLGPLLTRLLRHRKEQDEALRRASGLTRREREVLGLLAEGADNGAIAQALVISPQTARTHIQNVLTKLGVHSRLEAAMLVTKNGMLKEFVDVNGAP
jgi:DNA-binding NarL/FixJ family response regulator